MAGLLDYLQQDPDKQQALRKGLLTAGIAMMAGQSPNFAGSLAQGAAAGMTAYEKEFEAHKTRLAQQKAMQAAMTPQKPATPAVYKVGGQSMPQREQAQAVAENMYSLPKAANPYSATVPRPMKPKPMALKPAEPAYDMLPDQPVGVDDVSGGIPAPIEVQSAQPGEAGGFDVRKYAQAVITDPNSPDTDRQFAFKLLLEADKAKKEAEFGTTPFIAADGNAYLVGKDGTMRQTGLKGPEKEGKSPYGQDLQEWLAVRGLTPETASREQLLEAYSAVNTQKDRRSPKTTVTVGGTTVINDAAREKLGGKLGADIGEQAAAIEGKWSALDSVREAKQMLDKGIYAGPWAEVQMNAAKRTRGAVGNLDRASNTEAYKSFIGNTVIPRLKEFGGNDSNEEMRYLQSVMGGDITMEPATLRRVLESVEVKIKRGIQRIQQQQSTIEQGGVPDLGPGPGRSPNKGLPQKPPPGVDAQTWKYMTPEERKLWAK